MKNFSISKVFFSLTVMLLMVSSAWAQNGKIVGKITDKAFNEPIVGLPVLVKGTSKVTPSNIDGRYELNLAPGTYTLEFKYISFKTKTVSEVVVRAGKVTELNVVMDDAATELGEVVVTSTYKKETVNALYSLQKSNIRVSDGISAEIIKRSPDKNTSEVLKRVSGASIQDNKFVIVRGLADRYNTSLMNNASLPSTESDKRAFNFDIIPSNLIDNIVVNKTASPDLPGDFSGGAVQITTRDFPAEPVFVFTIGSGVNTQSTFKDYRSANTGKLDFLGFLDQSRALPSAYESTRNQYPSLPIAESQQISYAFPNTYGAAKTGTTLPNANMQLSIGNNKTYESGSRFGYIASFSYRTQRDILMRERSDYNLQKIEVIRNDDKLFNYSNNLGGLLNFAYSKGNNKFALKNFYNNTFKNSYVDRVGKISDESNSNNLNNIGSFNDVYQNSLFNSVLEGQHALPKANINIDWNAGFSNTFKDQPDQKIVEAIKPVDSTDPYYVTLSNYNSPAVQNAGRVYSKLNENVFNSNLNLSIPFKLFKQSQKLKFGGSTVNRFRDFRIDALGYASASYAPVKIDLANGVNFDNIFSTQSMQSNNLMLSVISTNSLDYEGKAQTHSGYVMLDTKFSEALRIVWGARLEAFNMDLTPAGKAYLKQTYKQTDILPSANLIYSLNTKSNLRASASQTVNRPEFREIAAYQYFDFETDFNIVGEKNLKIAKVTNADLRYEFYPAAGEIISFSAFYKKFKNPIEQINNGSRVFTFKNAESANDYGVEVELRKKLNFFGDAAFWNNTTFYTNASYIKSDVVLDGSSRQRPLQGQSPYLINTGLQYNNGKLGVNAMFNRVGQRMLYVGTSGGADIYEAPRNVIDFQISHKLLKDNAELRFTAGDLLAQKTKYYYNFGGSTGYQSNEDRVINSIQPGRTFSLSFSYNLPYNK
ncbi:TonB-dependent receptor [Solitalea lacus]|uniref:TonB-dependent receptor n=1 Tax=Solitalea lacus TaxID=2911172 RepID=UPI001EDAF9E9|nr:TonB-dependent receptor [Solitalea lacus]UKJ08726.1 TonB-dependent receptor [Solitalea lacus]